MRLAQAAISLGASFLVPATVFGIRVTFQQLFLHFAPLRCFGTPAAGLNRVARGTVTFKIKWLRLPNSK